MNEVVLYRAIRPLTQFIARSGAVVAPVAARHIEQGLCLVNVEAMRDHDINDEFVSLLSACLALSI